MSSAVKITAVSQPDSILKRSTVREGRVDSYAVHAWIKWTSDRRSTSGVLGMEMLGFGREVREASKIKRCLNWPWGQAGAFPGPCVEPREHIMVHVRDRRKFLLLHAVYDRGAGRKKERAQMDAFFPPSNYKEPWMPWPWNLNFLK